MAYAIDARHVAGYDAGESSILTIDYLQRAAIYHSIRSSWFPLFVWLLFERLRKHAQTDFDSDNIALNDHLNSALIKINGVKLDAASIT